MTSRLKTRAVGGQRSRLPGDVVGMSPRSILDLTGSADEAQHNASDDIDSGSPAGIDLNDPLGSVTGWLNHEERVYNTLGLEGELDLIAQSDEKPTGVKIGTLGYSETFVRSPFELLSESEAGSIVFLTTPPATDQTETRFDSATTSNNSTTMLMARATPLGLDLLSNLNLTSADSAKVSGTTGLVRVLIKSGSPSSSESLCATFHAHRNETDEAPMSLERCDNSFIPGKRTGSTGHATTQLWQYDPKTHELKPLLTSEPGISSEDVLSSPRDSASSALGVVGVDKETQISHSTSSSPDGPRTTQPSIAAQQMQSTASNSATLAYSSTTSTPSQTKTRRRGDGRMEAEEPLISYTAVAIVQPYTLVFVPRTASETGTTLPDSPV